MDAFRSACNACDACFQTAVFVPAEPARFSGGLITEPVCLDQEEVR